MLNTFCRINVSNTVINFHHSGPSSWLNKQQEQCYEYNRKFHPSPPIFFSPSLSLSLISTIPIRNLNTCTSFLVFDRGLASHNRTNAQLMPIKVCLRNTLSLQKSYLKLMLLSFFIEQKVNYSPIACDCGVINSRLPLFMISLSLFFGLLALLLMLQYHFRSADLHY